MHKMENKKVAIVRLRGANKLKKRIEETMKMLRLYNKNSCIVVANTDSILGMLRKIKDYVTWGELDEETFKMLLEKRGRIIGNKSLTEEYLNSKAKMGYDGFAKEFSHHVSKKLKIPSKPLNEFSQKNLFELNNGGLRKWVAETGAIDPFMLSQDITA